MIEQRGLSRRRFLAVAVAGSAVAGSLLIGRAQLASWTYPASSWAHLDDRMAAVLKQLGGIWLPREHPAFPAPGPLYLAGLDRAFGLLPAHLAAQVVSAIQAFDWAAIVYGGHGRPFAHLDTAGAHAYVQRWARGRPEQRALIAALRQLVCVAYWGQASTWPATGYRGPLHQRAELPSLGDAPEPVRL